MPGTQRLRRFALTGTLSLIACGGGDSTDPGETAGTPVSLEKSQTGPQTGTAGAALAADPTVVVRDDAGNALAGVAVTFTVVAGDGWVVDATVETDAAGRASTGWYLGPRAGESNTLRAKVDALTTEFTATAEAIAPGDTVRGRNDYIEYVAGDLPLIISAPHGGTLEPGEIPNRTTGTTTRDMNTLELAHQIAAAFEASTGRRPHVVVNRLHRKKLDANREIVEAAQGNAHAERAWREYHSYLEAAYQQVVDGYGTGFFIDVHGHGHTIQRLELGYALTASELGLADATLNQPDYAKKSTIRTLTERSPADFVELLRGATSLGSYLEAEGYPSVPSASQPDPGEDPYFSGGYNVRRYGSVDGGPISGVQIEANLTGVRDDASNREAFAAAIATVMERYFDVHYGFSLEAEPAAAGVGAEPATATPARD